MERELFRKSALEKLSTPEKLDQLVTVLGKKAWLSLLTLTVMVISLMTWGFFGVIKTRVEATGILLGGEVNHIVALSQGEVTEILIQAGDEIKKGQIIARIAQPLLSQQIKTAEEQLSEMQSKHERLLLFENQESVLAVAMADQNRKTIQQSIEISQNNLAILEKQALLEFELLEKGLITRPELQVTQQKAENAKQQIELLKLESVQLSKQSLDAKYSIENQIKLSEQRRVTTQRSLTELKGLFERRTLVKSPFDGNVLELLVDSRDVVSIGSPLIKIAKTGDSDGKITGILYLQTKDGKKVTDELEILVSPVTVLPEEYGYMVGQITYISEYPTSSQGMMRVLKNEQLVSQVVLMGAPIEINVEFEKHKENGKYFWTSGEGPSLEIQPGTPCSARITIDRKRPIELVIPGLKRFFGVYN